MFRKIISRISFSSALVGQLGFYARRLRREEMTRRIGLIFTVLALIVQSLVIFQPPQSANASNPGDFVSGGLGLGSKRSINNFLRPYDANSGHLRDIMTYAGITREEIANAKFGSFLTTHNHYSWGRVPNVGTQAIKVTDATGTKNLTTVYARDITINNGVGTRIYGWAGHSAKTGWFFIMQACGNLVTIGIPDPPKPPKKKCEVDGKRNLDADDPNCFVNCPVNGKTSLKADDPNCYADCNVPGKTDLRYDDPNCFVNCTMEGKTHLRADDPDCAIELCTYEGKTDVPKDSVLCTPPSPGNIEQSKSVTNLSQGSINATSTLAQAGDELRYTITVKNTGGSPITTSLSDNLFDSLEYANLVDYGGGNYDEDSKVLSWQDVTLASGESQARSFTMKLKNAIPSTPIGQSDPISYDCRMMNSFGNLTDVRVACPVAKVVETVVTELPHTGITENLIFAGIILAVVVYFYLRSRQLGKEVKLIRRDVHAGVI